jgi:ElaB/YqjD/DUF883 family membrane-anchored ribosome-binding protein
MQAQPEAAKSVAAATRRLSDEINRLLAAAMRDWIGEANAIRLDLKQACSELKDAIDATQGAVDVAQKVVVAVGRIDRVAEMAVKLLS